MCWLPLWLPWQTKGSDTSKQMFKVTKAGQVVSIHQMIWTKPGFVLQLKGKLTNQCYKAATVFVDYFSDLQYTYMMTHVSGNKALKAKLAFEQFAATTMLLSSTIMQTMDASWTMPSLHIAINGSNDSPTVASMPTSKMALLREQFTISPRPAGNSCMPWQVGQMQSIWLYGHMHCIMQYISTTLYGSCMTGCKDWKTSPIHAQESLCRITMHLHAQCFNFCKIRLQKETPYQGGHHANDWG